MSTAKYPLALWFFCCLAVAAFAGDSGSQKPEDSRVKHVDPNEAQKLIAEKKVIVLDIRTPKEFKSVHIAGATNIDFLASDFEARIAPREDAARIRCQCFKSIISNRCTIWTAGSKPGRKPACL